MSPTLDHIVILVPHDELQALPPWLTEAFTVITGGQHAGGVTENKLILFQDGVYIEIIAFVGGSGDDHGSGRRSHRWGAQPEGHIIDWALSLTSPTSERLTQDEADEEFKSIQARVRAAGAGLAYQDLVAGGRTTPDGVVLKWATASPAVVLDGDVLGPALKGGVLPFWCLDRTERKLRVPYASDEGRLAQHPSAAVGVAGVTLHVADPALLDRLRRVYGVLLVEKADNEWELAVPEKPSHGLSPRLKLALLGDDAREKTNAQGTAVQGWIELSLFTTGESRTVGGHFVDGWRIEVRLEHAQ